METNCKFENNVTVHSGAVVGYPYIDGCGPTVIGDNSIIRAGSIVYADVSAGDNFQTGHNVVIRENTSMGRYVLIGSGTIIDGNVEISDFVKIESNCYVCTHATIGTRVFIGPNVVFTNDKYPLKMRDEYKADGPIVEDLVTVSAGSVLLPGVRIGEGSFVAAGTLVTKSVPPHTLVKGNPGRFFDLPEELRGGNMALNWIGIIHD